MKNAILAGWILIYWGQYGIDTISYFESEARCNHVKRMYMDRPHDLNAWGSHSLRGEARCIPDNNEEGLPR